MILTQYELTGPDKKVFWLPDSLPIGAQIELTEFPGPWTVTGVFTSLPDYALTTLPHRRATIRTRVSPHD